MGHCRCLIHDGAREKGKTKKKKKKENGEFWVVLEPSNLADSRSRETIEEERSSSSNCGGFFFIWLCTGLLSSLLIEKLGIRAGAIGGEAAEGNERFGLDG